MARARKTIRRRPAIRRDDGDPSFAVTSRQIKWAIGLLGGIVGLYLGWQQVWDRFDAHWRLESIQATQDKSVQIQMKAIEDKASAETKAIARRAEVGRAWLLYSLGDFRADNGQQWAQVCPALKQPPEVCEKWKQDAQQARQEAMDAKRQANEAGKDK